MAGYPGCDHPSAIEASAAAVIAGAGATPPVPPEVALPDGLCAGCLHLVEDLLLRYLQGLVDVIEQAAPETTDEALIQAQGVLLLARI